jgi:hypothetical protein
LIKLIEGQIEKIAHRFFICDDSGSMASNDGKRLFEQGGKTFEVPCSRWDELVEMLKFHIGLAKAGNAACDFRLLNGLSPKRVGVKEVDPDNTSEKALLKAFENGPRSMTPLCGVLNSVVKEIRANEHWLRDEGKTVSLIIACDGQASDGNIAMSMKPLERLVSIQIHQPMPMPIVTTAHSLLFIPRSLHPAHPTTLFPVRIHTHE